MNRDEIICMAREAGLLDNGVLRGATDDSVRVERFAALVAAAEREACAQVCDTLSDKHTWEGSYANECAAAIRARSRSTNEV